MISIQTFVFNALQENTYVLFDESRACVIIDPGCYEKREKAALRNFIEQNNLKVERLLNTHCHVDHVLGNAFVKQLYQVPLQIHAKDEVTLRSVVTYAPIYGFTQYEAAEADSFLAEGDLVQFGDSELEILFVPGHAPGHIAFYNRQQKICLAGDVLFRRSIGRTDLPGGDFDTLMHSIHTKLFPLGDDFVIYPGHGGSTTIGEEKRFNPYCTEM